MDNGPNFNIFDEDILGTKYEVSLEMELGQELPVDVEDYDTKNPPDFLYWRGLKVRRDIGVGGPILN